MGQSVSQRPVTRPAAVTAAPPRAGVGRRRADWTPYAFLLPLLAVFAGFYVWPALNTLAGSLFRWGLLNPWRPTQPDNWDFVGLDNYVATLASARFWNAVVNTGIWLVLFPLLVTGVSLLVAVAIWHLPAGGRVFRAVFLLPMTISLAAAGVIWSFVYDPDFGVLSAVVERLGVAGTVEWGPLRLVMGNWLSDPGSLSLGPIELRFVNVALVVAGFWAFTGFGVITITAGLTGVPEEMIEAARVDGARTHQLLRYVLIPALRGPLTIVATISVIFALRTFDIVWVITQGGPAQDSEVLAVLLWKQAFVFLDSPQAGLATAVAVLMSAVLVAGAFPYLRRMLESDQS
jgi:ABC-type sugar transport system permease subunit